MNRQAISCRYHLHSALLRGSLTLVLVLTGILFSPMSVEAYVLTPQTWNTVGLDSNDVNAGPNLFPVGAKVCGGTNGSSENVYFEWQSANGNINLRPGSKGDGGTPLGITFGADGCADAFFEVQITRTAAVYDTARRYRIYTGADSTPTPRELYAEHLISQARNAITNVKVDGVSIPAGGAMNLTVGNTYTIDLIGGTATQGYNQFSSFFTLSNTIFQILSVSSVYSADNSPYVPDPVFGTGLYADACKWDNELASPTYRSCVGGDYKAGGSPVTTTYKIKIIGGGGSSITLSSLLFDFSGSSFHYNGDYSTGARIANIIDPASTGIGKSFSPTSAIVNGVSTLTVTLTNPNAGAVSGLEFTDLFPVSPGAMTLSDTVTTNTCGGTLTNNLDTPLAAGNTGIKLSNGTVAANSSCIVQVNVTAAATGSYTNTTQNLLIKTATSTVDTGKSASAGLTVSSTPPPPPPPSSCTTPVTIATWTMPTSGQGSGAAPPPATTWAADMTQPTASYVSVYGSSSISAAVGNPVNAWGGTAPVASSGGAGWSETASSMINYFQFLLDTRKYGGVTMGFDGRPDNSGDWANPSSNVFINTKGNAGFIAYTPVPTIIKNSWGTFSNIAVATGTTDTTIRIGVDGAGSNKRDATFYLDNVIFNGCPIPNPPTITKTFATNPLAVGGSSALTFTITNPNACCALAGIAFADVLPLNSLQGSAAVTNGIPTVTGTASAFNSQLAVGSIIYINKVAYTVAAIPSDTQLTLSVNYAGVTASGLTITSGLTLTGAAPSTTCTGGSLTTTTDAATGASVINLSGGSIAAGGSATCTVTATVKDSIAGAISNVSGAVTSTSSGANNGATGVAKATLTAILPPQIAKRFSPNPIQSGGTSTLTFLLNNPNQNNALTGVAFTDAFPGTMQVGAPLTFATSGCGAPTFAPVAGNTSLTFSNGSIAAGATCTVSVNITATGAAGTTLANTSSAVSATTAGTGNTASDTLTISAAHPAVGLLKENAASSTPAIWGYYLGLPVGGNVYYKLSVYNDGDVVLSNVTVSDPNIPAATISACAWKDGDNAATAYPLTLQVANNSNNQDFASCIIGPITVSAPGTLTNTATASVVYGGSTYTDSDYAIYATTGLTLAKSATQSYFIAAGDTLNYGYLVTNSGSATLNGPITVSDNKATVTCPALNTIGNLNNYLEAAESITCAASYTVTAGDVTAKAVTNLATASSSASSNVAAAVSNTATKTVPLSNVAVTKTYGTASIPVAGSSILTFTLTNVAGSPAQTNLTFTDTLTTGSGLTVTGVTPLAGSNCSNTTPTFNATSNPSVTLTNASMAAGATLCTFTATVQGNSAGVYANTNAGNISGASAILDSSGVNSTLTVTAGGAASITMIKSVQTFSDPVNNTTTPKPIPGAVMQYTVQVINNGAGAADNNTTVVTDSIPADTILCVTAPCIAFSCSSTPPCGLTFTHATDVSFSSGAVYPFTPVPDIDGYDANVTKIHFNPKGTFSGASGGNDAMFSLVFKVKIK